MNSTEQELRREIARLSKERDELKQLVKDSMSLAERCALKCEELNREAKELKRMYCIEAAIVGRCTPALISQQQGCGNCFNNEVIDANANNQDFRTTDMG
jgi:hypothetical protein